MTLRTFRFYQTFYHLSYSAQPIEAMFFCTTYFTFVTFTVTKSCQIILGRVELTFVTFTGTVAQVVKCTCHKSKLCSAKNICVIYFAL